LLQCDNSGHGPSLLRAEYDRRQLEIDSADSGLFRYRQWLPVRRRLETPVTPVAFRSESLAARLGMDNLWYVFSGYWPQRGGFMETCSFKELEAYPVCARIPEGSKGTMVVSSAGNTGRAFLQICSQYEIPLLMVVPEVSLPEIWITVEKHPKAKLAVVKGDADYLDAIQLAGKIASLDGYYPEGGARNIARRDGMGTVVLAAAEKIGRVPDHYFQAVGSGTGAIAAWEMSTRLLEDGRYGNKKMKLHLVQNKPFVPMSEAWNAGSRDLAAIEEASAKQRIAALHAMVLSNRKPPYAIVGGVFDALRATDGQMYSVTGEEALLAGWLFESLEGCDLDPAAEVAVAGLVQGVRQGKLEKSDVVLLNLTGGGRKLLEMEKTIRQVQPEIVFTSSDQTLDELEKRLVQSSEKISV